MYRFFSAIVEPLLEMTRPKSVLEIGSDDGDHTRLLVEWARTRDATVHAVDPAPRADLRAWQVAYGAALRYHALPSLDAIPRLPRIDVALIDGDHNFYTVREELRLIAESADRHQTSFPITLIHDVGWPYGRRDLYYEPERVPQSQRRPHRRAGMEPGRTELLETGGFNAHMENATVEGEARSGVLTAVEDFLGACEEELDFRRLPGLFGLGLLIPKARLEAEEILRDFWSRLELSDAIEGVIEAVESARIVIATRSQAQTREIAELLSMLEQARRREEELSRNIEVLETKRHRTQEFFEKARTRIRAFEENREQLHAKIRATEESFRQSREQSKEQWRSLSRLFWELADLTASVLKSRAYKVGKAVTLGGIRRESPRKERVRILREYESLKTKRT